MGWTAFTMHGLRSASDVRGARQSARWLLTSALLLSLARVDAAGFEVRDADTRVVDGIYLLESLTVPKLAIAESRSRNVRLAPEFRFFKMYCVLSGCTCS